MKDNKNKDIDGITYKFDEYALDTARRELRRGSSEIELQPRVFDLLHYLVRNRDRAIDKDELQDAVWPGMVVTETALTRAVMKARKAVNDDASAQTVIKTLHGHGYRFIATVDSTDTPAQDPTAAIAGSTESAKDQPEITTAAPRRDDTRRLLGRPWLWLALTVLVLALVIAWVQSGRVPRPEGDIRVAVLPVQNLTEDPDLAWTPLGIMSLVSQLLASENQLSLVPDGQVISLVDSFGRAGSLEDPDNEPLLDRLRRVYGTTHVLAIQLVPDGLFLRMNYELLDANDGLQRGTMVGEEPTGLAKGVVQGVYGLLLGRSRLGGEIPLVSVDPFNNEAFARGLGLSLEGRCDEATRYFRLIAEQEPTLFSPRYELASCLRILGETEEAEALLLQLVAEQKSLGPSLYLARSELLLGILYNRSGRLDAAESSYQSALEVSRTLGDPELSARILQNLSILAEDRNDWEEAWRLLDLALLDYQKAGREVLPGQFYSARANLKMDQGELAEAADYLEQALASFREVGDRRNEAMMLNNTGYLRRLQGRLDEAEDFHLRSLAIREEIGDRVGIGRIYGMLTVVFTEKGKLQQALETAEKAVEIARETRDRLFEGTSLAQLGDVQKALGEPAAARQSYLLAREVFLDIQDGMRVMQCDLRLAGLELGEERFAEADATAREVLRLSREQNLIQPEVEAMVLLGDIADAREDLPAAIEAYSAGLDRVRESSWAGMENTLLIKMAAALLELGDTDSAAPLIGALSRQENSLASLRVQARFAFESGDAARAVAMMRTARDVAQENWSEEAAAELRRYEQSGGVQ